MDLLEVLLDSWDRQCRILDSVASLVTEENKELKPSDDGWELYKQLRHIQGVRYEWLSRVSPKHAAETPRAYDDNWEPVLEDLDEIKAALRSSARAIRDAVRDLVREGNAPVGGYDNPVIFLQHMVWHEGWHVGLMFLALRRGGQEPTEPWEEANVWGQWRVE